MDSELLEQISQREGVSKIEPRTKQFIEALETKAPLYQVELTPQAVERLSNYYELLNEWNSRLHLVAPTAPGEFAVRHVLESLLLLQYLPEGARVADIGSGAGLPILPCLISRADVEAILIEASKKKAVFLREALKQTSTSNQASVIADRFENITAPDVDFVTCRALERFEKMLPTLVKWTPAKTTFLFFAGEGLVKEIQDCGLDSTAVLIPNSKRRFLVLARKE
ncbi:MAG: 16S rRNA (guanine(527)-N(7))-methyltransferase RsmG [Acidobacteriota bacterium]|nr:16S rRNA (guanine(527)-N(7))-methyltransferase RsmG [Acidobacteriota bacterium]